MSGAPDPTYDIAGALDVLLPGIVIQRQLIDVAAAQYAANGFTPITATQAVALLATANTTDIEVSNGLYSTTQTLYPTALPPLPAGLPRFADSNPAPFDDWAIDQDSDVAP